MSEISSVQPLVVDFMYQLQEKIVSSVESWESDYLQSTNLFHCLSEVAPTFQTHIWKRDLGGGSQMKLLHGNIMEKMGVNVSVVYGKIAGSVMGLDVALVDFWATGLSLVAHPKNPFVPPVHLNIRMFVANGEDFWFGGAFDLNPIIKKREESTLFHDSLKEICDGYNGAYYEKFSRDCDRYFFMPHRGEHRGIGGIFFDKLQTNLLENFAFIKSIGSSFVPIYSNILHNNVGVSWGEFERKLQLQRRGRYAEFNLIYDQGIKFGLNSGGNPDFMFMSMPPMISW